MAEEIQQKLIEEEMKEAYMDYAMSVIVSRALPDINDGLKPVHRRILYTMYEEGMTSDKQFRKSAAAVGNIIAKRHPHGDMAVYDALVRMVQPFSLRYTLIDGHGNFGCFTGDTKVKLLDGTSKSFKELCEIYGKDDVFYVYSVDKDGNTVVGEASNPRITKRNAQIIEIILDNGKRIRCTPNHKFLLNNLKYKEAKDLKETDSLMPGYFKFSEGNIKNYLMVKNNVTEDYIYVHDLADNYNLEKGAYSPNDGHVRHHINFNKYDNNPINIKRIGWNEHTKIHNDHLESLWRDGEFRKKQSEGVKKYYKENPEAVELRRKRIIGLNKDPEFITKLSEKRRELYANNPKLREDNSKRMKFYYKNNPQARIRQSIRSKSMWEDNNKRNQILNRLNNAIKSKEIRNKISKNTKKFYIENPEVAMKRGEKLKDYYKNNPMARKKISVRSKELWKKDAYRSRFINKNYNHFSIISRIMWENPANVEIMREKAYGQWKDKSFRENVSKSTTKRNIERIKKYPNLMNEIAQKAAVSHKKNWKRYEYKTKIIRNKILGYVNYLINKIGEENINENTYDLSRYNNCFPRFNKAITYFKNIQDMISSAKEYNHKIISIKWLNEGENVYDITVKKYHNFLLDAGVFVHNSIEGFSPAAQRYTEARLSKFGEELLQDIEKETVDFIPNFDGTNKEPVLLPSKIPNLLVNGSSGIAVGMATNFPPHNLREIIDGIIYLIDNKETNIDELMQFVKGPDFPTAGIIIGRNGILNTYRNGRGHIKLRARTKVEENKIIITEIPYQVNKNSLIENIATLVREKSVEGISDIRDESDRKGMGIMIEIKKGYNTEVVLNQLYKNTQMEVTFGAMLIALDKNQPIIFNLKQAMQSFIDHRVNVITRRTRFDLEKARNRLHILEGLSIALNNIDDVVRLIKNSRDVVIARRGLIEKYNLTEIQSNSILEMRLQRLTSLEQDKIRNEIKELQDLIKELQDILSSKEKIFDIIKKELLEIRNKFGDDRRTEILDIEEEIFVEDLIQKEDVVITATYSGYIKQTPLVLYRSQARGGIGVKGINVSEDDLIEHMFVASNHSTLLFFTNKGKVHWLKAYQIPQGSRIAKGKAIVNLINLEKNEKLNAILPLTNFNDQHYLIFVTKKGLLKKTSLEEYSRPRQGGIRAINIRDNDELVSVRLTPGNLEFILASKNGQAIKFNENDVRPVGRNATGVRGIKLRGDDEVVGLEVALKNATLLTVTENGFGKRTDMDDYRLIRRGGSGVINIKINERNGKVVGIKTVRDDDEVMLISKSGIVIRMPVVNVSSIGRNTQGVTLMKLREGDKVTTVARTVKNGGNVEK